MALKIIENFYDWSASDFAQEGISQAGITIHTDVAPRANCGAMRISASNYYAQFPIPSASTIRFAVRLYRASSLSNLIVLSLREGSTNHVRVGINASGYLTASRSTTVLGTAAIDPIPVDTWTHIEGKIVIHDTTGSVELRVNGSATPALNLTGQDTRNSGTAGTPDSVWIGASSLTESCIAYYTDFVVWDEAGESPTGWIGDCRVDTYLPTGAGSSTEFAPSAGANWECVDDPDGDTSYVETATTANLDLYAVGNMTHTPATIHAVAVTTLARKTDAGTGSVKLTMKSVATTAQGSAEGLSDASYSREIYARGVDPNTSAAWAKSAVDALEAGIEAVL